MAGCREALLIAHVGGRITRKELRHGLQGLLNGMLLDVAAVLDDEEFLKYAGVPKGIRIQLPERE
jgi:hypothetical protein